MRGLMSHLAEQLPHQPSIASKFCGNKGVRRWPNWLPSVKHAGLHTILLTVHLFDLGVGYT